MSFRNRAKRHPRASRSVRSSHFMSLWGAKRRDNPKPCSTTTTALIKPQYYPNERHSRNLFRFLESKSLQARLRMTFMYLTPKKNITKTFLAHFVAPVFVHVLKWQCIAQYPKPLIPFYNKGLRSFLSPKKRSPKWIKKEIKKWKQRKFHGKQLQS